jgi:hypothetical protein
MGFVIVAIMAVGVVLILTGKVPTAFALILIATAVALVSGASLAGEENSLLTTVYEEGAVSLASTMIAVLFGSWLGSLMKETAIAATLVRKTVEFGGDRPVVVALGILVISALCGAVTGSAPAALLAGVVGIPAMIAVGIPKVTAAGTILMGIGAGMPFELPLWQFFSTTLDVSIPEVRGFMLHLFPFAAIAAIAFVLIETRRQGAIHEWSMAATSQKAQERKPSRRERLGDAPWFALLTPLVPIVLALALEVPIIPSMLAGIVFATVTTSHPRKWATRLLRSLYDAFEAAAPPIVLFISIGMLLGAVNLPGAVSALTPIVERITPTNPIVYVIVFTILVPLCLYRGPLNLFGLGAGIAGAMTATGVYNPLAVLGLMTSYNQVFGVVDPTSTQTVWAAQYSGVKPQQVLVRALPYVWVVALGGIITSAVLYV